MLTSSASRCGALPAAARPPAAAAAASAPFQRLESGVPGPVGNALTAATFAVFSSQNYACFAEEDFQAAFDANATDGTLKLDAVRAQPAGPPAAGPPWAQPHHRRRSRSHRARRWTRFANECSGG